MGAAARSHIMPLARSACSGVRFDVLLCREALVTEGGREFSRPHPRRRLAPAMLGAGRGYRPGGRGEVLAGQHRCPAVGQERGQRAGGRAVPVEDGQVLVNRCCTASSLAGLSLGYVGRTAYRCFTIGWIERWYERRGASRGWADGGVGGRGAGP